MRTVAPDPATLAVLAAAFFVVALVYASVGFGGGSSYLALLTLAGVPLGATGPVALVCNVIVVAGGSWHFVRAGYFRASLLVPFLAASLPAAYVGGHYRMDVPHLPALTGAALLASAAVLLLRDRAGDAGTDAALPSPRRLWTAGPFVGGTLGVLSGVIGIGGGIFLAPVLHLLRWGNAKQIAAAASLFILANSLSGLAGQASRLADPAGLLRYSLLFVAVLVGGQLGSRLGAWRLSPQLVRRLTAAVVAIAGLNLLLS